MTGRFCRYSRFCIVDVHKDVEPHIRHKRRADLDVSLVSSIGPSALLPHIPGNRNPNLELYLSTIDPSDVSTDLASESHYESQHEFPTQPSTHPATYFISEISNMSNMSNTFVYCAFTCRWPDQIVYCRGPNSAFRRIVGRAHFHPPPIHTNADAHSEPSHTPSLFSHRYHHTENY
jgi:hypothetical protein